MANYFETLKQDYRHDYLTASPRKAEVIANAAIKGDCITIMGGTYNRALIISTKDAVYLQSYDTLILKYDRTTGRIEKLWDGYSVTTLKHVNAFMESVNGQKFSKSEWIAFKGVSA